MGALGLALRKNRSLPRPSVLAFIPVVYSIFYFLFSVLFYFCILFLTSERAFFSYFLCFLRYVPYFPFSLYRCRAASTTSTHLLQSRIDSHPASGHPSQDGVACFCPRSIAGLVALVPVTTLPTKHHINTDNVTNICMFDVTISDS